MGGGKKSCGWKVKVKRAKSLTKFNTNLRQQGSNILVPEHVVVVAAQGEDNFAVVVKLVFPETHKVVADGKQKGRSNSQLGTASEKNKKIG
jgi:hypothetical protein